MRTPSPLAEDRSPATHSQGRPLSQVVQVPTCRAIQYTPDGQAACQRQTPVVRPLKYYADGTVRERPASVGVHACYRVPRAESGPDNRSFPATSAEQTTPVLDGHTDRHRPKGRCSRRGRAVSTCDIRATTTSAGCSRAGDLLERAVHVKHQEIIAELRQHRSGQGRFVNRSQLFTLRTIESPSSGCQRVNRFSRAGDGNRTRVLSLGSWPGTNLFLLVKGHKCCSAE